jgi:hypothetical protein
MGNVVTVTFGKGHPENNRLNETIAELMAEPWQLQRHNAEMVARELEIGLGKINAASQATVTWRTDDSPEVVGAQIQEYAERLQAAHRNAILSAVLTTLLYGCQEQPRAYP